MIPSILPFHYFDGDIFQREQEALFQSVWQFCGFRMEVENHNDYLCRDIGGKSVIVQNFGGTLSAFLNVCSHRFSRIRGNEAGSGPLTCPYHGWSYDHRGVPTGIPSPSQFQDMSRSRRETLSLESWQIESCGQFIFVKRRDDGVSLRQFLGDTYGLLERVSAALGERLDLNRYTIRSNWKIAVENALEGYHVPIVHPGSFSKLGTKGCRFEYIGPHSSWASDVNLQIVKRWQPVEKYYTSRPFQLDGYFHQLIFPNITIVTLFGTTFSVQHFRPVSPTETECSSHVFSTQLTEPSGGAAERSILESMNKSSVAFNRVVFDEDRNICEQVQRGIEQNPRDKGALGKDEERVFEFQRAYNSIMMGNLQ